MNESKRSKLHMCHIFPSIPPFPYTCYFISLIQSKIKREEGRETGAQSIQGARKVQERAAPDSEEKRAYFIDYHGVFQITYSCLDTIHLRCSVFSGNV